MKLSVIQHPIGTWGLRRSDGKIMMRMEQQACSRPLLMVLALQTKEEVEALCDQLNLFTTDQRQEQGIY